MQALAQLGVATGFVVILVGLLFLPNLRRKR